MNLTTIKDILELGLSAFITEVSSDVMINAFNSEQNSPLKELATHGLRLYFLGFFFAGFNIILVAFFSATEQAKKAFVIAITRGCIAIIPFVAILSLIFKMNGVWLSFVFAEITTAIIGTIYLFKNDYNSKPPH